MTTEIDLEKKTVARREREGARRREEILSAARKILAEEGIVALSMLRLAKVAGYSRPTVYKYFPTKEDVLLALYSQLLQLRRFLIRRVEAFDARPRERFVAITEINAIIPHPFSLGSIALTANIVDRASSQETQRTVEIRKDYLRVRSAVLVEAFESGDLVLPSGLSRREVSSLLKNAVTGTMGVSGFMLAMRDIGLVDVSDSIASMRRIVRAQLDALAWRPLSTEWDYEVTMKRIYEEVFPPELLWEVRKLEEPGGLELDL